MADKLSALLSYMFCMIDVSSVHGPVRIPFFWNMMLHHGVIGSQHFEVLALENKGTAALKHWHLITP